MAVVIRLQGLKISAGSEDIRSFFTGLQIPDGGVHIVGGELEEAFIIFASDEDARRAMTRSGGCIKGSPVNLLLSSKTEMQNVLEASTKTSKNGNRRMYREDGRQGETESRGQQWPVLAGTSAADPNDVFLSLFGLPFAATKEDVWLFFEGLRVDKILFLKKGDGSFSGSSIVKFASAADAAEGTKRDRQYIGSRYVRIRPVKEQVWLESGGASEPDFVPSQAGARSTPPYSQRRPDPDASRSRSPCRSRSTSPSNREFCVLVQNLSHSVATSDIQTFFHPIALGEDSYFVFKSSTRIYNPRLNKSLIVNYLD
uniref:RNA binding motif protein 12B n=1 Tax=Denticeps clupeoides TaxID=299321 RepID=A0AAY4CSF2_9TELE